MVSSRPELAIGVISYSPQERRALAALPPTGAKVTTSDLARAIYDGGTPPFHAAASVTSVLRTLIRKVEANREDFRIRKSKRIGPSEIQYWRESARA
jgi:hypothetical protein